MTDRELMNRYSAYSFALTDLNLYLDSHPNDNEALKRFQEIKKEYECLREEYVRKIGPLTITDQSSEDRWSWTDDPWPWEIEGACN